MSPDEVAFWPEEEAIEPSWRQYERQIEEHLRRQADSVARVEFDQRLPGRLSGVTRQVDVVVLGSFAGVEDEIIAIVDCKAYSRKVDVKTVEAFMGLFEDVNADLGIIYTTVGFTNAAKSRVGGGIRLRVVERVAALIAHPEEALEWVDYWTPVSSNGQYVGDYFEYPPHGPQGARITYARSDGEDWRVLYADPNLVWGDPASNGCVATLVLGDYLGREPSPEDVEMVVEAFEWRDGEPWVLTVEQLKGFGLSPGSEIPVA